MGHQDSIFFGRYQRHIWRRVMESCQACTTLAAMAMADHGRSRQAEHPVSSSQARPPEDSSWATRTPRVVLTARSIVGLPLAQTETPRRLLEKMTNGVLRPIRNARRTTPLLSRYPSIQRVRSAP